MFHEKVLTAIFEPIREDIAGSVSKLEIEELNNMNGSY
jgi:hypothetical protein